MINNGKLFLEWWRFTKPSKPIYFLLLLTVLVNRAAKVIAPIFAAFVIDSLVDGNYKRAMLFLTLGFVLLIFRNFIMHINYMLYHKVIEKPYLRIQGEIAEKVYTAKNKCFKTMPKGTFLNIIHTDTFAICDTIDLTATKIGDILQVVTIVVTLFTMNIYIALIMLGVVLVNFFILEFINIRKAIATKKIRTTLDDEHDVFSTLFDSKDYILSDDTKQAIKEQFLDTGKKYIKAKNYMTIYQSICDNWFFVFYNAIIFGITFFLIQFVAGGKMSLATYLILVPYLLLVIESSNAFFDMFKDLKNVSIHVNRIQKVLNLADKPTFQFGQVESYFDEAEIDFVDVSAAAPYTPPVQDINFHIRKNQVTLIHGPKDSGKRTIFYLLTRDCIAQKGKVLINGLDCRDYTKYSYQRQLNAITTKQFFLRSSIINNLRTIEKSKQKIYEICKEIGIHEQIMQLPKKYNTEIENVPKGLKYLLRIARILLANCEILLFYEMPNTLTEAEQERIKNLIVKFKTQKTIVLFSRSFAWADICGKVIEIENGQIKDIKVNN